MRQRGNAAQRHRLSARRWRGVGVLARAPPGLLGLGGLGAWAASLGCRAGGCGSGGRVRLHVLIEPGRRACASTSSEGTGEGPAVPGLGASDAGYRLERA